MSWLLSIPLRTVNNTKTQENVSVHVYEAGVFTTYVHIYENEAETRPSDKSLLHDPSCVFIYANIVGARIL